MSASLGAGWYLKGRFGEKVKDAIGDIKIPDIKFPKKEQ